MGGVRGWNRDRDGRDREARPTDIRFTLKTTPAHWEKPPEWVDDAGAPMVADRELWDDCVVRQDERGPSCDRMSAARRATG